MHTPPLIGTESDGLESDVESSLPRVDHMALKAINASDAKDALGI